MANSALPLAVRALKIARALASKASPIALATPTISGTPTQGSTLTGVHGDYTAVSSSYAYRWLRDAAAISGATSQTYGIQAGDIGHDVAFEETPTNAIGPGTPNVSPPVRATPALGPTTATVPASTATDIVITGLSAGETVASTDVGTVGTGKITVTLSADGTAHVVTSVGRPLTIAITASASIYLAAVSSAPLAVWGMRRMVAAYNGPLYQLTRLGGAGGTMDVSPKAGSDLPDYTAIAAWASGYQGVTVTKRYDQSGNGRDQTPNGTAPNFDVTQALAGCVPAQFKSARMDATVPLNRANITVLQAVQIQASCASNQAFWSILNGATYIGGLYYGNDIAPRYSNGSDFGVASPATLLLRANPATVGFTSNGTERRVYSRELNGILDTVGGDTSAAGTTFAEGVFTPNNWLGNHRNWGTVLYPALPQADTTAVITSINAIFSVPTAFTSRLVIQGDSIVAGSQLPDFSNFSYLASQAKPQIELVNLAVGGTTLLSHYSVRSIRTDLVYTSAYGAGKCALLLTGATNDLAQTGSQAGYTNNAAGTPTGASVYSIMQNFVTQAKGLGYKVATSDVLPRLDSAWTTGAGSMESERLNYNAAMNSGSGGGADSFVRISDTTTIMGALTAPRDPTLYNGDKLHPTKLGTTYLAAEWMAALVIAAL